MKYFCAACGRQSADDELLCDPDKISLTTTSVLAGSHKEALDQKWSGVSLWGVEGLFFCLGTFDNCWNQ